MEEIDLEIFSFSVIRNIFKGPSITRLVLPSKEKNNLVFRSSQPPPQ